jgi:Ribbon-helix-helix domain
MIRTQVQLSPEQVEALRRLSKATGRSIADLVRQGVDEVLSAGRRPGPEERLERAKRVAGQFSSGGTDVSIHHDRYLAEAFEK